MGDGDLETTGCSLQMQDEIVMAIGILIVPSLEIVLIRIGNVIVTATTLYFVVHDKLQMLKH